MIIYKPKSFHLINYKYLFFDIFIKNNKLYLILPLYYKPFNESFIHIFYKNKKLKLFQKILNKNKYEPSYIFIYNIVPEDVNKITVIYNKIKKIFILNHIQSILSNNIVHTTLFKDDFQLIPLFYNYYKKLGIQHFYFYYNGILNDYIKNFIKNISDNNDITLIQWNFQYWNNKDCYYIHHAQLGQMNHSLYYFGKNNHQFILFNDLDEFIDLKNKVFKDIIENNLHYQFQCILCEDNNKTRIPKKYPTTFQCANPESLPIKSKWLYDIQNVLYLCIHKGTKFINKNDKINNDYCFYHFYNWSIKDKKKKHKNPIMIKTIKFNFNI
jgi:hypothetical protein